jgi:hypothetical protein
MAGDLHQVSSSRGGLRSALFVFLFLSFSASAHPSVSIVVTPGGDVFYSDLEKVWRIAPNGQRSVAVANVHAHELALDPSGALLGEDSRWLGGDHYQHRIWKRAADGRITDVVPWTERLRRPFGLDRDGAGAQYRLECTLARRCTIQKRVGTRVTNVVSTGQLHWLLGTPAGELYYIDGEELRRVTRADTIQRVAHIGKMLMGMTLDRAGNVYVAAYQDRAVVRVTPNGTKSVVVRSTAPWAPTGVGFGPRGELWVLEWHGTQARARRVG